LHILHNCAEGLRHVLGYWDVFIEMSLLRWTMGWLIVWITSRDPAHDRVADDRRQVPLRAVYTSAVRQSLLAAGAVPEEIQAEFAGAAPAKWAQQLTHFDEKVFGLALLRTSIVATTTTLLTPTQRALMDYWGATKYWKLPLVFVDIVEVISLATPQRYYTSQLQRVARSMFSTISLLTADRCFKVGTTNGVPMSGVIQRWANQYGLGNDVVDGNNRTCAIMTTPHALLCSRGYWKTWGFPFFHGNLSKGMGFHIARPLWEPLQIPEQPVAADFHSLDPSSLQCTSDVLRTVLQQMKDRPTYTITNFSTMHV